MKIVTINRLFDGRVAYLSHDGTWADEINCAALFDDDAAELAFENAQLRTREVADIYLIDANDDATPGGRTAFREKIRSAGPTIREDLGKQAGNY